MRPVTRKPLGNQGFSLPDVLVGVALVAITLGGIFAAFAQTTTLARTADLRSTLSSATVAIAEWYRRNYADLPASTRNNFTLTPAQISQALAGRSLNLPPGMDLSATVSPTGISSCLKSRSGANVACVAVSLPRASNP